jgi:hypothetical protein
MRCFSVLKMSVNIESCVIIRDTNIFKQTCSSAFLILENISLRVLGSDNINQCTHHLRYRLLNRLVICMENSLWVTLQNDLFHNKETNMLMCIPHCTERLCWWSKSHFPRDLSTTEQRNMSTNSLFLALFDRFLYIDISTWTCLCCENFVLSGVYGFSTVEQVKGCVSSKWASSNSVGRRSIRLTILPPKVSHTPWLVLLQVGWAGLHPLQSVIAVRTCFLFPYKQPNQI